LTGFSAALRAATWTDHRQAESTAYLKALVTGQLDRAGYADMVAQHHFGYQVLEAAADAMRADPVGAAFITDALHRLPALERDLTALLGPGWSTVVSPSRSTQRYCDRMREVCFTWPGGFVAHHYTRYLGDLSGGQYLARAIERQFGTGVTAFYDFSALGDLAAFKDSYRQRLDAAPWSAQEQSRIIAETALAYELNTAVLVELGEPLQDPAPA
jgi:heme oxygenase